MTTIDNVAKHWHINKKYASGVIHKNWWKLNSAYNHKTENQLQSLTVNAQVGGDPQFCQQALIVHVVIVMWLKSRGGGGLIP